MRWRGVEGCSGEMGKGKGVGEGFRRIKKKKMERIMQWSCGICDEFVFFSFFFKFEKKRKDLPQAMYENSERYFICFFLDVYSLFIIIIFLYKEFQLNSIFFTPPPFVCSISWAQFLFLCFCIFF